MELGGIPAGPWVVAVSGGVDSMSLLHALLFGGRSPDELVAAHLDHAMRPGSRSDREWVGGVCRAWGVVLVGERLIRPPGSEDEARRARYAFLERVRRRFGATAILTAHHADDQAETVLFRMIRGTGIRGLQGIPRSRGVVHRPLLHRTRDELRAYAERHRVPFRTDPSNRDSRFVRNRIRHDLLPAMEVAVGADVRRGLRRLAHNARRAEAERAALEAVAFRSLVRTSGADRLEWPAEPVTDWPGPLRRRLLRSAAHRLGVILSEGSTRVGVQALTRLGPGQGVDLTGGLRLERAFSSWILQGVAPDVWDEVRIHGRTPRTGALQLGRRRFHFVWRPDGVGERSPPGSVLEVPADTPLSLRGWQAGDRIRFSYGSKSVSKLLAEHGVPAVDRPSTPVVVGPDGVVLWVPDTAVAGLIPPGTGSESCVLTLSPE
ncbi:MAG: tRNA lysidine(34) synthetase TilS [Gemmatimonadota bacterium]